MKNFNFLKRVLWLLIPLLTLFNLNAWGTEEVIYTLDGSVTGGTNGYATLSEDISITNHETTIVWNAVGNTTQNPWRIGGQSLTNVVRPVYSETAISENVTKVVVSYGSTFNLTSASAVLKVYSTAAAAASGGSTNLISTVNGDDGTNAHSNAIGASKTHTFARPNGNDWTGRYFRFEFTCTYKSSSNKYFQLSSANFYADVETCTKIGAPTVTATPGDRTITLTWANQTGASSYTVTKTPAGGTVGTPSKSGSTWTCEISGLTNGTAYTWSVEAVGSGDYCASGNTAASSSTTPNATYTITYHDKDGSNTTTLTEGTNIAEALNALYGVGGPTSCDAVNYEYFYGWKEGTISGSTTTAPTILSTETASEDAEYYAVWTDTDPSAGSWEKVTSISVGDEVVFAYGTTYGKEMTGVSGSNIGTATDRDAIPDDIEGTYILTIGTGNGGTGYSFKNGNNYLSWSSGNNLYTSTTLDNNSSWTISTSTDGNFKFANVGTTSRILQYNSSSPRWACYTGTQQAFQIYKQGSSGTAHYITTCCTPLGTINGSVSVTDDGCSAGGLKATWTMNSTTGIASYTAEVYDDGDNLVKTVNNYTSGTEITGLNRCKMYTVKIYTVSEGAPYCAGGEIGSDVWQAHGFSYTITKNHVSLKAGEVEDETTCDAATFGATYEAESGYNLPTSITINNAGSEGTGWIWDSSTGSLLIDTAYVTGNVTVTITGVSSSCSGAYSLHTGNSGAGGWITNQCFEDADWGHVDDAIWVGEFPSTNAVYVGYAGGSSYYGAEWAVGGIKTYDIPTGRTLGWNSNNYYQDYPATALGTFHIYKNSTEVNGNYYLRFKPTTYVLRTGANSTWTSRDMTISATNSNYYETAPLTLTSTLISEHAYVDLKANNGEGHVWCNFSNDRTASGNVKVKNGASTFRGTDLQASDNGTYGKFQIDITQDVDNWKLAFVPMYRITYAAGTGASGSMEPSSYQDVGGTIAAAANGFTAPANKQFAGWSGSDGNSYAAGDNVTMNSDVTLTAQWEWIPVTAITISHSTLDKYVDDANVTLTVTSVTPSGASSSVTWSSSNPSVADVNSSTGEVDFLAVGTTTITATSTVSSGITATCAVTVWAKPSATFVDNLQNLTEDKDGNALSGYNLTAVAGTPVVFPVLANQAKGSSTCEDQHYRFVGWTTSDNNTDPQDHLVTSHTLANGDAITYYAVWADGVEGASYTRLTSNTFKTSPTKYVIGADDGDGTDYFFYSCEKTDQNNSWGLVSADPSTDAPIQFTLSGTAAALVVTSTEATARYLNPASGKQFFGMSSTSKTVVLDASGVILSTADTYNNLRYNSQGGLRWYTGTNTGTAVYFYEVGAGSTVHYRTSCCTNKVEAPDVTATKTSTSITLTWGDETGATGWEVSWNGGAFGSPSGTRTHTVSGLTPNTTYTWQVRATYDPLVKCGADIASGSTTTNQVYHVTYAKGDESANCNATGSTTDDTAYEAGATVTLQGNEFSLKGYTFNEWTTDDPDVTISSNQFTMPDHDVVITATWTAKVDKYFDRMHDQTDALHGGIEETESGPNEGKYYIQMTGCNYAVPIAIDRNTGDACQTTHYKLQGWIAASHMKGYPNNMDGTIKTGEETNIFPPTGTKTATGATYYAIWAEVTE